MTYSALLLGSVGVLAETADMRARAFNAAFAEAELGWTWDAETLGDPGGAPDDEERIASYAATAGQEIDAGAIADSVMTQLETLAAAEGLSLRDGVADVIAEARAQDLKLGLVSDAPPRLVKLVLSALGRDLDLSVFDYIGNGTKAARPKPAQDIYNDALRSMDVTANAALAIEDTPEHAEAAIAAGIRTLVYPRSGLDDDAFPDAATVLEELSPALLRARDD